ncbi:MAG: ATP-dependent protease ATPase subunit HslU [Candidatus Sumerlaeota bacterium]|nr:ATP-dependent protease ATPase subunit HslU [Candidatus Sumerlaeota bacterium]
MNDDPLGLSPKEIVQHLDKYIVGQVEAKKMVAIALRNRARRMHVSDDLRDEVMPKNIIMIGPTGVGKTEIARRLSRLAGAPFIKVEASKYTEVGYVGRDVESMVRELTDTAVAMTRDEWFAEMEDEVDARVRDRLLDMVEKSAAGPSAGPSAAAPENPQAGASPAPPRQTAFVASSQGEVVPLEEKPAAGWAPGREELGKRLDAGELEDFEVEMEVKRGATAMMFGMPMQPGLEEMGIDLQNLINQIAPPRVHKTRMTVEEAREIIREEQLEGMLDQEKVRREAVARVEQNGIIFIDEIDKVAGRGSTHGPDVSREGVQRDLLPIVEGSTVFTKHGPVRTDHILFIASGAFHVSKPCDLIPELQGRFPLRVTLTDLTAADFVRILSEPTNALTKQYAALMATEGVEVEFTPDGIEEMANSAYKVNRETENIGARRLYTMMEKVMEEVAFNASEMRGVNVRVDRAFVRSRLKGIIEDQDLSKFIL